MATKLTKSITIGPYQIGPQHPPFIVAELSGNHNRSLEQALLLVDAAKQAGVHAIKLQTYTADTITLDSKESGFFITDQESLWKNRTLYDLYQEAHLPWEWHLPIIERCRELNLLVFSTPFDETAVEFLETLQMPCYKIASLEIVDHELIQKVASTGKPLILSTGAATLAEIEEAVGVARKSGCRDLLLLKCTAAYPALPKDANLRTIPHLAASFDVLVGLSDHTLGIGVALASVAMGACMIEKHMTLSRANGGVDSAFSLEPDEFAMLVKESANAWESLGTIRYAPLYAERATHSYRPSLYFIQDIEAGCVLQSHHFQSLRPGYGLPPKEREHLIGLTLQRAVNKGTPVSWEVFRKE